MIPAIVEKIERAGKTLDVSRRELEDTLVDLFNVHNIPGVRKLFEAYKDWELRGSPGKRTAAETVTLAKENLDYVCEVADTICAKVI